MRMYRTFEEARAYARALGLIGVAAWWAMARKGDLPADIPAVPAQLYRDQWVSWADWLGSTALTPTI